MSFSHFSDNNFDKVLSKRSLIFDVNKGRDCMIVERTQFTYVKSINFKSQSIINMVII